jgi:hypothetical protein
VTQPCVVCGERPHDRAYHERYRTEYRATAHLLRRSWPRLRGVPPRPPGPVRGDVRWYARVLPGGTVVHTPVKPGDRGYEEGA